MIIRQTIHFKCRTKDDFLNDWLKISRPSFGLLYLIFQTNTEAVDQSLKKNLFVFISFLVNLIKLCLFFIIHRIHTFKVSVEPLSEMHCICMYLHWCDSLKSNIFIGRSNLYDKFHWYVIRDCSVFYVVSINCNVSNFNVSISIGIRILNFLYYLL